MDETLKAIIEAIERLDSGAVVDRVAAVDALARELPRLADLTEEEWGAKIVELEDDVEGLRGRAEVAAALHERAERTLETLLRIADRDMKRPSNGAGPVVEAGDGRRHRDVVEATSTREALLYVMSRRPKAQWTPLAVHDLLMRFGRTVTLSNVQVTMRRMAEGGEPVLQKLSRRGAYRLIGNQLDGATGSAVDSWSPEVVRADPDSDEPGHDGGAASDEADVASAESLRRLAGELAEQSMKNHPCSATFDELVDAALRAVAVWTKNQGRRPDDKQIRRLMNKGLWHLRDRIDRESAGSDRDVGGDD